MKKRSLIFIFLVIFVFMQAALAYAQSAGDSSGIDPPPVKPPLTIIEQAIQQSLVQHREQGLVYLVSTTQLQNLTVSNDGLWATASLVPTDPETQEILPTEPGLAIARKDDDTWTVFLPGDPGWSEALALLPADVISPEQKEAWQQINQAFQTAEPQAALTGYLLPWEAGRTVYLSRSLGHDADITSGNAHYAFDFYIPQTMFNFYAAKAGRVYMFKDTVANGDSSDVNYLVLEDTTTVPTSYQLYMHLAQGSIAPALKVIGTPVQSGQFLAVADDTGQSTGHHLHFQVQEAPYWTYWGRSLDIVFADVSINGGRPRSYNLDHAYCRSNDVCSQFSNSYVSGNTISGDRTPPVGDILSPLNGETVATSSLHLEGWASDAESGFYSAQFIVNYDGAWREIGNSFSSLTFSQNWDLCSSGVPDGPFSIALRLHDRAGNITLDLPGLRHLIKSYACPSPPPACVPNADQVALYDLPDFAGSCTRLGSGSFSGGSGLGNLGEDKAESIQVGANLLATLYSQTGYTGRSETFSSSDRNLSDNRIGSNSLSSLKISLHSSSPAAPAPAWPANGASFSSNRSLSLVWEDAGGGSEYQARLDGPLGTSGTRSSPWQSALAWHPGNLGPGAYTWQVKARSSSGESAWSSSASLTITDGGPPPPPAFTAPFSDSMEAGHNQWVNSGNWDQTDQENHTSGGAISWWYDTGNPDYNTGEPNSGDLTSPPISIPASGYYLRFWYKYETEGPGLHWDQRRVQISVDGGGFTDLLQLSDDPPGTWLQSPAINLSAYAGHAVRIRFYFVTLDSSLNSFRGWMIDDFTINTTAPPACSDGNDTPAGATPISYGNTVQGSVCPAGDLDYYRFSGNEGDVIGILAAKDPSSSPVDTYLFLLDSDGRSILAENDDIEYAVITDSFIHYRLPQSGTYYLKIARLGKSLCGRQRPYLCAAPQPGPDQPPDRAQQPAIRQFHAIFIVHGDSERQRHRLRSPPGRILPAYGQLAERQLASPGNGHERSGWLDSSFRSHFPSRPA